LPELCVAISKNKAVVRPFHYIGFLLLLPTIAYTLLDLRPMLHRFLQWRWLETRAFNLTMAFFCHELLLMAYYFQYVEGLEPCPLCIFQRVTVFFIGLWFLLRGLHAPRPGSAFNLFYSSLSLLTAAIGIGIAGRHVWLQSLPKSEVPACGPALDYMMDILPFSEVLTTVLTGAGECAEVSWSLWGLSMPAWTLVFFIGVFLLSVLQLWRHFRPASPAL